MTTAKQLEQKALEIAEHARKVQAVNDELCAMLEDLAQEYLCGCGHKSCRIERTRKEIDELLAKARGVK